MLTIDSVKNDTEMLRKRPVNKEDAIPSRGKPHAWHRRRVACRVRSLSPSIFYFTNTIILAFANFAAVSR